MTMLKRVGLGLLLLLAGMGGLAYFYVIDGGLPTDPDFDFRIADLRSLSQADPSQLPHTIEVVSVGSRRLPSVVVEAGLFAGDIVMNRTSFRLRSEWGDTLIDVGMDETVWEEFSPDDEFSGSGFAQVREAMGTARRIIVTHEHPDHMGFLVRYDDLSNAIGVLRMTSEQIAGTAKYSRDGAVPGLFGQLTPLSSNEPSVVAPGVVVLPAPGHTPGSVVIFVRMQDGKEVLFLGDIVWNMSNIRNQRGRSRLMQDVLMPEPEERSPVYNQLAALIELANAEPDIQMIPSHDDQLIQELTSIGRLRSGFEHSD
ncbi:MAG: MBL fold metallo-hydrolase [Erythrobacter sp.]